MKETAIIFDNVSKSYPLYHSIRGGYKNVLFHLPSALKQIRHSRFEALKSISFEIYKGETFGIIGENGAGKSTMLGLIAGVLKPTTGIIKVAGKISPLLELGSGFHYDLTGKENILLNGVLLGLTKREVISKMDDIIDFSELGEFIDQPIRTYSSGMLARLGFSIVSSLDPEILLIDEILAVGDINFQKKCRERMISFRNKGVTMVLVSHSMAEVENMCDRVALIERHMLKSIDNPSTIIKKYTKNIKDIFYEIYERSVSNNITPISGSGATIDQTREIIKELPVVLKELNIRTLLDLPCGDFNWMNEINLDIEKYIGADIVEDLIADNQIKYGNEKRQFISLDITTDPLPEADLILCRDCLVQLSYKDVKNVFKNIKKSKIKYIMTTTFTNRDENIDIVTGGWRPLNLKKPPFNFPKPIKIINEKCTEVNGEFADKSLGIWLVDELKDFSPYF